MGQLIDLAERAADRSRPTLGSAKFFFALDCPLSYLAAERVERALGEIEWVPVLGPLGCGDAGAATGIAGQGETLARERLARARVEADRLGLPLVEPPRYPLDARRASRVAVYAAAHEGVHQYALSMARLVFCGGFDPDQPDAIAEAAAAAGLDCDAALRAADDPRHDLQIDATSRGLRARGLIGAPAIRIGRSWFEGADPLLGLTAWSEQGRPPA
jgi:2-hydroxychromene-2-carboxylate isomerase